MTHGRIPLGKISNPSPPSPYPEVTMPSMHQPRKPYALDPRDAVARLYEIFLLGSASFATLQSFQKYRCFIAGGGEPVAVEYWTNHHVVGAEALGNLDVIRQIEGGRAFRIAAYKEMPLFAGDNVVSAPGVIAALELLTGGRVGIREDTSLEILRSGDVRYLSGNGRKGTLWEKFTRPAKPLTIQTRGGGSLKG